MRAKLIFVAAGIALGLLGILAGCANPPVVGRSIGEMTWWDTLIRTIIRDSFIAYTVPIILGVVGFFLNVGRLRWAILGFSVVYLGFVLGLTVSSFGLVSTMTLNIASEAGFKQYAYLFGIFIIAVFAAVAGGRLFCSWVCPMGAIQQFLYRKGLAPSVNRRANNWLRWVRYGALIAMIVTVAIWRVTWWGPNDPFRDLFRQDFTPVGLVLMVGAIGSAIFFFAPWCRYVCPLGALLALFSKLSVFKIKVDQEKCTDCGRCWRSDCSYGAISPGENGLKPKVNQLECTSCGECLGKCPEGALGKARWRAAASEPAAKESNAKGVIAQSGPPS